MEDVKSLREREKELNCLYFIQQLTLDPYSPLETVFEQVVESVGAGWQRPETTGACIDYFGRRYADSKFNPEAPHLTAPIRLGEQEIGRISVSDSHQGDPCSSELFLPEESSLLKSIARLLSNLIEWRHLEILGRRLVSLRHSHWQWRERVVAGMVKRADAARFGRVEFYLGGSTQEGRAGHGSDIDLYVYPHGTTGQKEQLKIWLEGWSLAVGEAARIQTGEIFQDGIFNVRWLNERPDTARSPDLQKVGETGRESDSSEPVTTVSEDSALMIERMLLGLSHEFRNPLTVISTDLDLLLGEPPQDVKEEIVSEIARAVSHLSALVKNLILFLRAETGLIKPPLEEVDVANFVRAVLSTLQAKDDRYRILRYHEGLEETLKARLNRGITERILRDLIDNAVLHSESDVVHVTVDSRGENTVVVSVKDEGRGIDEVHHDKLFEQFYRLEPGRDRESGGAGLGLPLARALARSQNSGLELESRPAEGTNVSLTFPRVLPSPEPAERYV